jgi:hypothetical protein
MPQQVLKEKISSTEEFMMGRIRRIINKDPVHGSGYTVHGNTYQEKSGGLARLTLNRAP